MGLMVDATGVFAGRSSNCSPLISAQSFESASKVILLVYMQLPQSPLGHLGRGQQGPHRYERHKSKQRSVNRSCTLLFSLSTMTSTKRYQAHTVIHHPEKRCMRS
ncbi:unnamed protein product [Calypogeia fissa]